MVLSNHFEMLGASPVLGRGFLPDDGRDGAEHVVVLAYGLWQRRFGSDPSAVGRTIEASGVPYLIVGVMGSDHLPLEPDWQIWAPIQLSEEMLAGGNGMAAVGRLVPGVTVAAAQAESRRIFRQYQEDRGESVTEEDVAGLRVVPVREWILGTNRTLLLVLLGAVGFLVLIACANVANLLLAYNGSRRQEFALRQAVGASRSRILRQLLTEAALLAVLGGTTGVALAYAALAYSVPFLPADLPRSNSVGIDSVVLAFALAASLTSAVLFGLAPALRAADSSVCVHLGGGNRGSMEKRQQRMNHGLVAVEVALAVTLVVGAGLMLRSSWKLAKVDPGFDPEGVLTLRVAAPPSAERLEDVDAFHEQALEALRAVPGVVSAGAIQFLPMRPGGWWSVYRVLGEAEPEEPRLAMRVVTHDYFSTMGITVRSGPEFSTWGRDDGVHTTLINDALARRAFPASDPLGRQILLGVDDPQPYTIVGVVGDVSQTDLRSPSFPEAYLALRERPWQSLFYAVKVDGEPARFAASVKAAVWSVHDRAPISSLSPLSKVVASTVVSDRLFTGLLTAFGLLALLLGTVGVYGVMSYVVSQRKRELGIRMAVGASAHELLRATVIRGMIPVALGIAAGLLGAITASRVLSDALFGVQPNDTLTLVAVPTILGCSALFALYVPARRASRLDPMHVLRE